MLDILLVWHVRRHRYIKKNENKRIRPTIYNNVLRILGEAPSFVMKANLIYLYLMVWIVLVWRKPNTKTDACN